MGPKIIMFCYFSFIIGHIICLMLEGSWLGADEKEFMETLIGFKVTSFSGWEVPKMAWGYFTHGFPKMLFWDYSFLYGTFGIFRVTILWAISIGVIWGFAVVFASFVFGLGSKVLGW